jgi:hypothetical protein
MKATILWDVMLCSSEDEYQRFGRTCYLYSGSKRAIILTLSPEEESGMCF